MNANTLGALLVGVVIGVGVMYLVPTKCDVAIDQAKGAVEQGRSLLEGLGLGGEPK